jgi:Ni,Fe-hydrogenase III component G
MSDKLKKIKDDLGDLVSNWRECYGRRYYCDVEPANIVPAARRLVEHHGLRLATASGVDARERLEIIYHFSLDVEGAFISLCVTVRKEKPEVDSLAPYLKAAEWIEREVHEMFGIKFIGHPHPKRLLLADDWPEGVYPLRRDGKGLKA